MTNKRNSFVKLIACTLLAAMMLLGATPMLALDYSVGTDSDNPAKAALTKIFRMPSTTVTPEAEFTFTFTAEGMVEQDDDGDEIINDTDLANMPEIDDVFISFAAKEAPINGNFISEAEGEKQLYGESPNFLDGMVGDINLWKNGEGKYSYIVEESVYALTPFDIDHEFKVKSEAKYQIVIWVELDNATGKYFPKYVCAYTIKGFIDEYYEDAVGGEKVPGEPGEWITKPTEDVGKDDFSKVIFTNRYYRNAGPVEPEEDSTLSVIKTVAGDGANTDKYFAFTVKVTKPTVVPGDPTYAAYVVDDTDTVVTSAANFAGLIKEDGKNRGFIVFASDAAVIVNLKHNQRLVFIDLHEGAKVAVMEAAAKWYKPSYVRTFAGTDEFTGEENKAFGFPRITEDEGPHFTIPGLNKNDANFLNTRTEDIVTGISVDSLPYIVLIVLAAAGFAATMVTRCRRYADEA
jgi:hypothetical protein